MRAIDPIKVTFADGVERDLVFTLGTLRRIRQKPDMPLEEVLLEGLADKSGLTADAVADLIPLSMVPEIERVISLAFTGKEPGDANPQTAQPVS